MKQKSSDINASPPFTTQPTTPSAGLRSDIMTRGVFRKYNKGSESECLSARARHARFEFVGRQK